MRFAQNFEKLTEANVFICGNLKEGMNWNVGNNGSKFDACIEAKCKYHGWQAKVYQMPFSTSKKFNKLLKTEKFLSLIKERKTLMCIYIFNGIPDHEIDEIIINGQKFIKTTNFFVMPLGVLDARNRIYTKESMKIRSDAASVIFNHQGSVVDISSLEDMLFVHDNNKEDIMWYLHEIANRIQKSIPKPDKVKNFQQVGKTGDIIDISSDEEENPPATTSESN